MGARVELSRTVPLNFLPRVSFTSPISTVSLPFGTAMATCAYPVASKTNAAPARLRASSNRPSLVVKSCSLTLNRDSPLPSSPTTRPFTSAPLLNFSVMARSPAFTRVFVEEPSSGGIACSSTSPGCRPRNSKLPSASVVNVRQRTSKTFGLTFGSRGTVFTCLRSMGFVGGSKEKPSRHECRKSDRRQGAPPRSSTHAWQARIAARARRSSIDLKCVRAADIRAQ